MNLAVGPDWALILSFKLLSRTLSLIDIDLCLGPVKFPGWPRGFKFNHSKSEIETSLASQTWRDRTLSVLRNLSLWVYVRGWVLVSLHCVGGFIHQQGELIDYVKVLKGVEVRTVLNHRKWLVVWYSQSRSFLSGGHARLLESNLRWSCATFSFPKS